MDATEAKARAIELRALGWTLRRIGQEIGRSYTQVWFWTSPVGMEAHRRCARKHHEKLKAARGDCRAWNRCASDDERKYRSKMRRQARIQSSESGEPVQAIYERWGIA